MVKQMDLNSFNIPPTIESCNGSLASNNSQHYDDHTDCDLLRDDSGKIEAAEDCISKRDKGLDKKWRSLVAIMMLGNALIITGAVYAFLNNSEKETFVSGFERHAGAIVEKCHYQAQSVVTTFESVSDSITTYVKDADSQEWPLVTISDFEIQSMHAREASFTELVGFVPLVANQRRMNQWDTYAQENVDLWLAESRLTAAKVAAAEVQSTTMEEDTAAQTQTQGNQTNRMLQEQPEAEPTRTGPFAPIWQLSPPPNSKEIIGYDLLTHSTLEKLLFAMWESQQIAVSPVMDVTFLTEWEGAAMTDDTDGGLNASSPRSVVFQPIYEEHNFHLDNNDNTEPPRLQGLYFGVLTWESYFSDLVPEGVNGIYCVIHNDCGQDFTFVINGREAVFLGEGDKHDPIYDENEISANFYQLDPNNNVNSTAVNEDQFQCHYSLSIYPSTTLQEEQQSSKPFFFTMVVGLIFVATFAVFLVYIQFSQHRTKKVERMAKASDKIITSLFPENVKKELMRDAHASEADAQKRSSAQTASLSTAKKSALASELLSGDEESAMMGNSVESGSKDTSSIMPYQTMYKTKPIANLFPETTIFFADLAGFTSWSSTRSPTEVFELLEAIYGCFDQLARKRNVYKVETIGDCYVAVTGLPKPNKRHALVMTRFAQDCLNHISKVTKSLEDSLGKDTSNLSIRIGLHSGPVTAGVLRGERSRFQLFGDTVNTAARMESNGKPRCIHVSEATAELLRGHGRSSWLRKREDLVEAKGKGLMQTYYVVAGGAESITGTEYSYRSDSNGSQDANVLTRSLHESGGLPAAAPKIPVAGPDSTKVAEPLDRWLGEELSIESVTKDVQIGFGKFELGDRRS